MCHTNNGSKKYHFVSSANRNTDRISEQDWAKYKTIIIDKWMEKDMTTKKLAEWMKEKHNFQAK